ncbi:MAG: Holliday junction resolvase [Treponema sp.]|nr:Holliday junction resolvase [Treponema sp.]
MIEFLTSHRFISYVLSGLVLFSSGWLLGKISSFSKIRKVRKDAVTRSRAVIGGQVAEQVSPFLPEFPGNPGDCRFVGKPVDFIVFSGMTENNSVDEILFVEVKTGNSALSEREKQVRDCVMKGRVRYAEYRI